MQEASSVSCGCGQVCLEVLGAPIMSVECCCSSCAQARERMATLEGVASVGPQGRTRFEMFRKDRVRVVEGASLLRSFRLSPQADTTRVFASCCSTPVFLEFQGGHWLSMYGCLWPEGALPPLQLRTMTRDLPVGASLPDDMPNASRHTLSFMAKLLGAWVAMGFRAPAVATPPEVEL